MSKTLKKMTLLLTFMFCIFALVGCGEDPETEAIGVNAAEYELRETLEGTRWQFYESTRNGIELVALDFTDHWRDEEDSELSYDVALTLGIIFSDEDPTFTFLHMRVYTESEPTLVTIFGYNVHGQEVRIYEEEPITIVGDVLHIGTTSFYAQGSDALSENMNQALGGN